jgi:hypothetical protein
MQGRVGHVRSAKGKWQPCRSQVAARDFFCWPKTPTCTNVHFVLCSTLHCAGPLFDNPTCTPQTSLREALMVRAQPAARRFVLVHRRLGVTKGALNPARDFCAPLTTRPRAGSFAKSAEQFVPAPFFKSGAPSALSKLLLASAAVR